jgi:hypothetical protein
MHGPCMALGVCLAFNRPPHDEALLVMTSGCDEALLMMTSDRDEALLVMTSDNDEALLVMTSGRGAWLVTCAVLHGRALDANRATLHM